MNKTNNYYNQICNKYKKQLIERQYQFDATNNKLTFAEDNDDEIKITSLQKPSDCDLDTRRKYSYESSLENNDPITLEENNTRPTSMSQKSKEYTPSKNIY